MSEFTNTIIQRGQKLGKFMIELINGGNGAELTKQYKILETKFIPKDILVAFDYVFEHEQNIEKIKIVSNKIFNLLYKILSDYPALQIPDNSLLYYLHIDNERIDKFLKDTKQLIKQVNKTPDESTIQKLKERFERLLNIKKHYTTVQNVLFPVLEQKWEYHQCLKLLWHIHDQIIANIKLTLEILSATTFDLKLFNRVSSAVYFDIYTVIFREEKVLFPVILETIDIDTVNSLLPQALETGFCFVSDDEINIKQQTQSQAPVEKGLIKLPTGELTVEQIVAIFNHLPVDITFVDHNDEVKFFSTPKDRIFPRTKSIIGRKVQNCHPPDSVHIVNKIVNSFREGKKDKAVFWIQTRLGQFILIQYFAVRDENGKYLGTLEVTQEVSEIRKLQGEKRLLDWED